MKTTVALLALLVGGASADVVLNKKVMDLALQSAKLSALAYKENPPGDKYENFGYFDDEPDQALTAKINGYCFGAFRGTTLTWIDWQQNVNPHKFKICVNQTDAEKSECCDSRAGFYDGYWTLYKDKFEKSIRDCAKTCSSADECVVLTGHSQGGAIAAVAALLLADLNPYVITFGQPNTIDAPCDLITSSRWYRFINTNERSHNVGLSYDPVPFVPGMGADSFGHMLLLSEDTSGVAYIGLDAQDEFSPLNVAGFEAHSMNGTKKHPGYLNRLKKIMSNATYPIRTTGYKSGYLCTENKECETDMCAAETHLSFHRCVGLDCKEDKDCPKTGRCDSGLCIPKLGSCEPCNEDSDCAGDRCVLFRCAGSNGLMDENCICKFNSDCDSGRCEGYTPPQCEAKLGLEAFCNEDSDCKSGYCSWWFRCTKNKKNRGKSARSSDLPNSIAKVSTHDVELPQPETTPPESTDKSAPDASKQRKKRSRIIFALVCISAGLVVLLGYYGGRRLVQWCKGYEEVPTRSADV